MICHLSKELFSILRIVEYGFRNLILAHYNAISFKSAIIEIMGKKHCDRNKYAKKLLTDKCELYSYLNNIDFGDLNKIIKDMCNKDIVKISVTDLTIIKSLRNDVMHHHFILANPIDDVCTKIKVLLSHISDETLRMKKNGDYK